jgi:hypothetical protein
MRYVPAESTWPLKSKPSQPLAIQTASASDNQRLMQKNPFISCVAMCERSIAAIGFCEFRSQGLVGADRFIDRAQTEPTPKSELQLFWGKIAGAAARAFVAKPCGAH